VNEVSEHGSLKRYYAPSVNFEAFSKRN
jgi:hypothetical protein